MTRRVVKIGGSLLSRPSIVRDLTAWFDGQPVIEDFVIVGGGGIIDAIRDWDAVHRFDSRRVHWHCVEALVTTFRLMADWFPDWHAVETPEELEITLRSPPPKSLVRIDAFYERNQRSAVPEDWRTTTDALALVLANRIRADSVVLLKSCRIAPAATLRELIERGVIDAALVECLDQHDR